MPTTTTDTATPETNFQRKAVHVIAHTHWDRSWYWPLERFRAKLVECVKAVIRELKAHPDYQFNFDGQVLMLEDYLQVCPDDRAYLQACARAGRVKIGPMYCLADVYCTGGEALIRNILLGKQWCEAFGGGFSRVLHMPDTFGITPCMPMIAAGFGLKAFSFMRGVAGQVPGLVSMENIQGVEPQIPPDTRFFLWRAPDGSAIPTIRLREGYASAAASRFYDRTTGEIVFDRYVARLKTAAAEWDNPPHDIVLVMAGVDHMIPWPRQTEAMAAAAADAPYDFRFSSLEAVADNLLKEDHARWPVCQNEFHGSGAASILGGTVSARIYLKQENAAIERLLAGQVEPAAALAMTLGRDDPAIHLLPHAWKTLLATHPHDDICGCSVDSVHRKNACDMQQAREGADAIRRRMFFQIMSHFGANRPGDVRPSFALVNFQATPRRGPALVQFDFEGQIEWGDIQPPAAYRIVDEAGHPVPFREVGRGQSTEHPRSVMWLELFSELRPFTVERFYLEAAPSASIIETDGASHGLSAENEHIRVVLKDNGTFDLQDKATGHRHRDLGFLSSQGDIGDTYDFSDIPAEAEQVFDAVRCRLSRKEHPGGVVELTARGELELPRSTEAASRTRSAERVRLPFTQTVVVAPGLAQAEVRLAFVNTAADHRLRWNLPLTENASRSLAGLKFTTIERPAGSRPPGDTAPRIFPEHPADHFVAAGSIACFGLFPVNYELVTDAPGRPRLAITICRSVSYLTNPVQGATRPGVNAGPHTLVPDARCLGLSFSMSFAVRHYEPGDAGDLLHQAALWRAQPLHGQIDATTRYPWRAEAKDERPLLAVDPPVIVSAFKPTADGRGVILRLHNASDEPKAVTIRQRIAFNAQPLRLDEEPDERWSLDAGPDGIRLTIPPFGLRTLRLDGATRD